MSGDVDRDPETREFVRFSFRRPTRVAASPGHKSQYLVDQYRSTLARMYLDKTIGFGYESREWRMYHLERYIDIITQIAMKYDPNIDSELTVDEFYLYVADQSAKIQAAIAEESSGFIQDGRIPQV